jgi:hypothetical protein
MWTTANDNSKARIDSEPLDIPSTSSNNLSESELSDRNKSSRNDSFSSFDMTSSSPSFPNEEVRDAEDDSNFPDPVVCILFRR